MLLNITKKRKKPMYLKNALHSQSEFSHPEGTYSKEFSDSDVKIVAKNS